MVKKTFSGWLGFAIIGSSVLAAGCDLLEFAQNPSVNLSLPMRSYSFSDSDPRWKAPPPGFDRAVPCNVVADCCMNPPGAPAGTTIECSQFPLICDDTKVCAMRITLEIPQTIDLKRDAPEFAEVGGRLVKEVLLRELSYTVDNQIGTDLPPVNVFVAPAGVMSSANSDQVKLLVSLPKTVAGKKSQETIALSPAAQQAFSARALDLDSPFNLIAGTDVIVRSGTPIPPGAKVDVSVTGKVTVKF
jgi:hypothetical protein